MECTGDALARSLLGAQEPALHCMGCSGVEGDWIAGLGCQQQLGKGGVSVEFVLQDHLVLRSCEHVGRQLMQRGTHEEVSAGCLDAELLRL